jgi:hypothetical protein
LLYSVRIVSQRPGLNVEPWQTLPIGTVSTSRPLIVALNDCHSSEFGQHRSPGKHRQPELCKLLSVDWGSAAANDESTKGRRHNLVDLMISSVVSKDQSNRQISERGDVKSSLYLLSLYRIRVPSYNIGSKISVPPSECNPFS